MVHVKSTGNYAWREDLYRRAGETLGERTTSSAIDGACLFTNQMVSNLREAKDHPHMTPELASVLSTDQVRIEIESNLVIE